MSEENQQLMQQNEGYTDIFGEQQYGLGGTPADLIGGSVKAGFGIGALGVGAAVKNASKLKPLISSLYRKGKVLGEKVIDKGKGIFTSKSGVGYVDDLSMRLKASGIPGVTALRTLLNSPQGKARLLKLGFTVPMITIMMTMGEDSLFSMFGGDEKKEADFVSPNEQRRQTFDAGLNPRTGVRTPPEYDEYGKLVSSSSKTSDTDYWKKSISGLPHDTRLMRLGQLMDYYGKTPKQRAAVDMPSKVWAENEARAAKIKADLITSAAAAAKTAGSIYGKKSIAELAEDLLPDVKKMFGDTFWGSISSNPNASDEPAMMSIASQVATNIKAITTQFPDLTPDEVRQLALEQFLEDSNLEDLR
jgi:hypothetical protein